MCSPPLMESVQCTQISGGTLLEQVEARSTHSGGELEKQVQLGALSLEDLEAELSRRRDVAGQKKS